MCKLCNTRVDDNTNDSTLGNVLVKLATHVKERHIKDLKEYNKNLNLLQQILPAYFLIESFVDIEGTTKIDEQVGKLIEETQNLVSNTLALNIDVEDVVEQG
jgi:hypothetical protein